MAEACYKTWPRWMDGLLIAAELLGKHVYWSVPRLRERVQRFRSRRRDAPQAVDRRELKQYLRQIGVVEGALVMAHTSVSGLQFIDKSENKPAPAAFFRVARDLLDDLLELVGASGTLVMPTHPCYMRDDYELPESKHQWAIHYDPKSTPCAVGLVNELFWRREGVLRSLHPCNTLAAWGPLAAELLQDNLNPNKPLPHGVYSGYYRLCQRKGLVVSIGVPLRKCMTLLHVGEDVRDQQWPIKDFFEERRFLIRVNDQDELHVVRQCSPKYGKYSICRWKAFGDLIRDGVLHEEMVGTVPVGWARAHEVFEYLMKRNENSTFPYYGTWLAGLRS